MEGHSGTVGSLSAIWIGLDPVGNTATNAERSDWLS